MSPSRKRLRVDTHTVDAGSSAPHAGSSAPRTTPSISHDALLPRPQPGEEEEEEEEYLVVEEDTTDSSLIITIDDSLKRRRMRRKKKLTEEGEGLVGGASESEEEVGVEIDRRLDQSLETKSKQHNLTTVNVRNIIHEVITNEHVVAMMKAAINETEATPPFELKMTRSKLKEVVQRGVLVPPWTISPIKTFDPHKPPQFVDILLAEEDSSDEEYHPDEEEEDETAEDTFLESDLESSASSPRGIRASRLEDDSCSPRQTSRSRSRLMGSVSMGPPPPPRAPPPKAATDSSFLEKLHAVEEELAVCMDPFQPLAEEEVSRMACRTRSKRPLTDVPLGQLEAELQAPDITPDMYDSSSAHEDREWTDWLRGLMTSDVEQDDECDDEDDPEYNFLADTDEPDQEDYRDDKAVRITKKEVNELMEELFETLKEDLAGQDVDDEGHDDEEEETNSVLRDSAEKHDTAPPDLGEADGPIGELRTVKQKLEFLRGRQHTPNTHRQEPHTLRLDAAQRTRLQRQLQQHVQLLTQVHLLTSPVVKLKSEAETTQQFLEELQVLAERSELIGSCSGRSVFRSSNLQGALQLLQELREEPLNHLTSPLTNPPPPRTNAHRRSFPLLPPRLAWIFSTRSVFLHPELLPSCSLDPELYCPRRSNTFTAAEDSLLVLGLRNMEGSSDAPLLVSQFLLRKTLVQVRRRILQCCRPGCPDNMVKAFRYEGRVWSMPPACRCVDGQQRPPVEREERFLPLWLARSLPVLHPIITHYNSAPADSAHQFTPTCRRGGAQRSQLTFLRSSRGSHAFPPGTRYPPRLPPHLDFKRMGFVLLHKPLPLPPPRPSDSRKRNAPQRQRGRSHKATPPQTEAPASPQVLKDDIVEEEEEEEEEEGDVLLTLSDDDSEEGAGLKEDNPEEVEPEEEEDDVEGQREAEEVTPPDLSGRFLCRLGRSLGESSALYQQVVSSLQGSPAPSPEDLLQVSEALLRLRPHLQRELRLLLHKLHLQPAPIATGAASDRKSHEEEEERVIGAKNISVTPNGEKIIVWTREADRSILTFCQQRGANQKTFQQVSAHLGNKTAQQVHLRFLELMKLFYSHNAPLANQQPGLTAGQSAARTDRRPISSQD